MSPVELAVRPEAEGETGLVWHEPDRGFLVASAQGRFCGTVERTARGRFRARDARAMEIGVFDDAAAAQAAVTLRVP